MKELIIYEGAMCCSTGLCGPEPDKSLIELNETLRKLQKEYKDVQVQRASLSFNMNMFLENKNVFQLVKENGPNILPIMSFDGQIISKQKYLSYDELKNVIKEIKND